jgi:hypothetical protein
MTSEPIGDRQHNQRVVLVADLDGEPMTVLSLLEEFLRDLAQGLGKVVMQVDGPR